MENKIISGIYYIKNKKNNKIYIGSSKNVYKRKIQHYSELRGNYHNNIFLQRSWNKYGEENFEFGIIEIVDDINLLYKKEQFYIDKYYDSGIQCYNLNPIASKPPINSIICALYDINGVKVKQFNSFIECSEFLNLDSSNISHNINNKDFLYLSKYRLRIFDDIVETQIEPYVSKNPIYLLDDKNKIKKEFNFITDLDVYINNKSTKVELSKIAHCLSLIHKYKKLKVIYKQDFDYFKTYPQFKLTTYKYILKYDYKGNLIDVINNKYGLKFSNKEYKNSKINTRLLILNRKSLRVCDKQYIYIRSNDIIEKIQTGVSAYIVLDIITNEKTEFLKRIDLLKSLNISKKEYELHYYNNRIYNNTYKFIKHIY